ncbi:MAG TPA: hypothetical protein VGK36_01520 [Candidatus Angelobacter sp.]|jgi:hypothetical protein
MMSIRFTEITSYAEYEEFSQRLRQLGFAADQSEERLSADGHMTTYAWM